MWKIMRITEADYGCEERLPGEKDKALVFLSDPMTGEERRVTVEEDFLEKFHLDKGSIWPQDPAQ